MIQRWSGKSDPHLLLGVLHPSHSHLPSAMHPHRVSVGGGGDVVLTGVRRPLLLGIQIVAHAVKRRALHHHRVHGRPLKERNDWMMSWCVTGEIHNHHFGFEHFSDLLGAFIKLFVLKPRGQRVSVDGTSSSQKHQQPSDWCYLHGLIEIKKYQMGFV